MLISLYDFTPDSGGMFIHSDRFVEKHRGRINRFSIFGRESNLKTRKLALMNLAIHDIEGDLGKGADDTFLNDLHPRLRADFILANHHLI